jgi:Domain of unknown function (DUF4234)
MAEEVQIAGTSEVAKIRNPLAPALLPFVTLGIYYYVWYYKINKELAEMGKARNTEELGTSPGTSLIAVLFGWILIFIPTIISVYNTWKRKVAAEAMTGQEGMEAGLGLLLSILIGPVGIYLLQRDLNDVIQAQAGGTSLPPAPSAPPVEQPAPPAEQPAPPPPEPPAQG